MTVWVCGTNVVLYSFCVTGNWIVHVTIKYFVKLQDIILGDRNSIKTFMYNIQYITISSYFLLITIFGGCLFFDELADSCICSDYAFNGI